MGPRSGAQQFGRYMIREQLGQGAFGSVFRAYDPQVRRDVAIKILMRNDARAEARFAREIKACAMLRHPGIVSVHESGEHQGKPFLVMEFVEGETLEELATSDRPLSVSRAVEIVRDAARAVQYAHDEGVLHRDLKPQNIMVDRSGQPRVLDFGLASLRNASAERLSTTGMPLGTPAYMSPEQAAGERVDGQTDVYGLGATLYYALTRETPLGDTNTPMLAIHRNTPSPPSRVDARTPPGLDAICLEALSKESYERQASPGDLADALDAFLAGGGVPKARRPISLTTAALGLLAAVVFLAVTLAVVVWHKQQQEPEAATPTPGAPTPAKSAAPTVAPRPEADALAARVRRALREVRAYGQSYAPYARVLERLQRVLPLAGDRADLRAEVQLAQARLQFHRSQIEPALVTVQPLLKASSGAVRAEAKLMHAITLVRLKRNEEGYRELRALAKEDPNGSYGLCAESILAVYEDRYQDGVRLARRASAAGGEGGYAYALLSEAICYLNLDREHEALRVFNELERGEYRDDAHFWVSRSVHALQRRPQDLALARRYLERSMALSAPRVTATQLRTRGQLRLFDGDARGAIPDFARAHELAPENHVIPFFLGVARDRVGDWSGAMAAWRKAYELNPQRIERILTSIHPLPVRLRAYRALGLPPPDPRATLGASGELLERWVRSTPPSARKPLRVALELAQRGAPWPALEKPFAQAVLAAPRSSALATVRAEVLLGRAHYGKSLKELNRARSLGANTTWIDLLECQALWSAQHPKQAVVKLQALAKRDPDGADGLCARGMLLWARDDNAAGLAAAKRAVAKQPTHHLAWAVQSFALKDLKRFRQAKIAAGRARALTSYLHADLVGLFGRASLNVAFQSGRDPGLVKSALKLMEFAMAASRAIHLRTVASQFVIFLGERTAAAWFRAAQYWLWEAAQLRPNNPEVHILMGFHRLRGGKPRDQVLAAWRKARRLSPKLRFPPQMLEMYRKRFGEEPTLN